MLACCSWQFHIVPPVPVEHRSIAIHVRITGRTSSGQLAHRSSYYQPAAAAAAAAAATDSHMRQTVVADDVALSWQLKHFPVRGNQASLVFGTAVAALLRATVLQIPAAAAAAAAAVASREKSKKYVAVVTAAQTC